MSKQSRERQRPFQAPAPMNGSRIAAAPSAPAAPFAQAKPPETARRTLTAMQSMAVRLMVAREAVKAKNGFIAKLQAAHGKRAQQDAQRIADLESEVSDLTQQLMQTLNNLENADNTRLTQEFDLPPGQISYQQDADGNFFYESDQKQTQVDSEVASDLDGPALDHELTAGAPAAGVDEYARTVT